MACTTHAHGQNLGEPQLKGSFGMRRVNGSLVFKHNLIKNRLRIEIGLNWLRIGTLTVVCAHCNEPSAFAQVRNFVD